MNTVVISSCLLLLLTAATFAEFETPVSENKATVNETLLLNPVPPHYSYSHLEDSHMYTEESSSFTYDVTSENQFITVEARDCSDFLKHGGQTSSGVYIIRPRSSSEPFHVYCDMEKDGGGWTVIQRRGNFGTPNDYFDRNWDGYKKGFGDLTGEFWLGNDKISALTNQGKYRLKMDLIHSDWKFTDLTYRTFKVDNELEYYKLTVGKFSTPGEKDDMSYHNGQRFSTKERDNDRSTANCAASYQGAWWYTSCYHINLNGIKNLNDTKNHIRFSHNAIHIRDAVMKIRLDDF